MKTNANMSLKFSSKKHLEVIRKALEPEIEKTLTTRARTTLGVEDRFLILKINAKDTVALRATINAYLRWTSSMKDALNFLENICQFDMVS